jgi:hypothetical protein
MKPKPMTLAEGLQLERNAVEFTVERLRRKLTDESVRFKSLRDEIIVKTFPHPGTAENLRLIRDHEIRSATFKEAARLITT